MNDMIRDMIRKMIKTIWGNLRTGPARMAWAKAQTARNKTDDAICRQWLIDNNVPDDVARRAWATGFRPSAIAFLARQADWIKYYGLEKEVREAFKKHTPQ